MNSWVSLQCVNVAFPSHTHLLFEFIYILGIYRKKNQMQYSVEQFILQGITYTAFFDRRTISTLFSCALDNQLYITSGCKNEPSFLIFAFLFNSHDIELKSNPLNLE